MPAALLLGLPLLGVWAFVRLRRRMAAEGVPAPPEVRLLAVLAAYGTLLAVGGSGALGAWSAVHSLAAALLLAVGAPLMIVQGLVTIVRGTPTGYHRAVAAASVAFPVVLAALYLLIVPG